MSAAPRSKIEIVNFGCRLNLVEGEAMRRAAEAAGRDKLIIVNTCAVTAEAARQARQTIRRLKRQSPDCEIIVTGCAVQTAPQHFAAMPEVARLLGNAEKLTAEAFAPDRGLRVDVGDIFAASAPPPALGGVEDHTRAFLAIQTGCDHRCTFCLIPYGRGASRSTPADAVIAAVQNCVAQGFQEIVLTGVDLTAYGRDSDGRPGLGRLAKAILQAAPSLARLRLSSIDCIEADEDLLDAIATEPRLMPHLHLSLQAGSDMILKRMKRRHSRADAVRFCAEIRKVRPDVVFGADLIAGFPTETEAMFAETLALVADCGLTHLHVFPFSPRPGTPAARMPQLPADVIAARAKLLRHAGAAALKRHLDAQIGRSLTVLTERGGTARAADFTKARVGGVPAGRLAEVIVTGHDGTMLTAQPFVAAGRIAEMA
ncbi:tRNA (N(6)-L-threonylcarbamoyladenosine(37)-C(2))-methylthiotransferase MtaB [uncultured Methylovirgula sp.]|uniref:tRNA (N(6)-L-threonylcarbamoyladenosine(37)-C(2))- methylthiotransferase MtaB n=1 Tax=uncultured Methylovirgula sp. TaxID=1285960 RepID=UPI0026204B02|nr:tRNA (N(6)-L-threonylcarbamoyladenosine(37)-C(2))-methylthiotransferase MtaB [uncultured Methylovirgula sp.]